MPHSRRHRPTRGTEIAGLIRKIRERLSLSQEALARRLNTSKGAVQHWERGRNNPDLARMLVLRRLCPAGPERRHLDLRIQRIQARVTPAALRGSASPALAFPGPRPRASGRDSRPAIPSSDPTRVERWVANLEERLSEITERVEVLEGALRELRRENLALRTGQSPKPAVPIYPAFTRDEKV